MTSKRLAWRCAALAVVLWSQIGGGAAAAEEPSALRGKIVFLRCASCHELGPGGVARIGPNLKGVVGRKAGSLPDFPYSPAMKAANFVWDDSMLDRWLQKPNAVVPGTAMAFAGIPSEEERRAVIAYLRQAGQQE